jgi:hypothetical protein
MSQMNKPVQKKRTADEYGAIMDDVLEDGSDSEDEQEPAIKRQAVAQMPHAMDPSSIVHQSVNNDGKKQKSQKRQKGEPKGKLTAYGFFSKEIRTHMKENNQLVLFTELATQTAALWRNMTEEQKAPYEQQAREDKERWTREMEQFKANYPHGMEAAISASSMMSSSVENIVAGGVTGGIPPAAGKKAKKAKKDKDAPKDRNAPKGPVNSFLFYYARCCRDLKQTDPTMENKEMARVAGIRWKALTAEEKAPFEQMAKEDKERHARQLAENVVLPPKGPINSYLFFYAEVRAELAISNPGMAASDQGQIAGQRWKQLSSDDRAPFEQKSKQDKERHARELAEYLAANPGATQAMPTNANQQMVPQTVQASIYPQGGMV